MLREVDLSGDEREGDALGIAVARGAARLRRRRSAAPSGRRRREVEILEVQMVDDRRRRAARAVEGGGGARARRPGIAHPVAGGFGVGRKVDLALLARHPVARVGQARRHVFELLDRRAGPHCRGQPSLGPPPRGGADAGVGRRDGKFGAAKVGANKLRRNPSEVVVEREMASRTAHGRRAVGRELRLAEAGEEAAGDAGARRHRSAAHAAEARVHRGPPRVVRQT